MNNKILTIYTPTYNRASLLRRLYNSLRCQINTQFIWLVIDDGSTDCTFNFIQKCKLDGIIDVEYIYKENGGVHTARDLAYELTNTELVVGIDSDDYITSDFVDIIINTWKENLNADYIGIISPVEVLGQVKKRKEFPNKKCITFQSLMFKEKYNYDVNIILKSSVIKSIPKYPVFKNEKLVPESFKWMQLPNEKFILIDKKIKIIEYQSDGYTADYRKVLIKNLNGFIAVSQITMTNCVFFKQRIKACLRYLICSFIQKRKYIIRNSNKRFLTFLLYPIGLMGYAYFKMKYIK